MTINNTIRHAANSQPLNQYSREKLHRSITYENSVTSFAGWSAFYGWCIGFGFIAAYFLFDSLKNRAVYSMWMIFLTSFLTGIVASGFTGLLALWVAKAQFGRIAQEYEELGFQTEPTGEAPELVLHNGTPIEKTRKSKRVIFDGREFVFTGRNIDKLLSWYQGGNTGIRKQGSAAGPGFDMLPDRITSSAYTDALYVLRGRGLVDGNNEWTESGINEFLRRE